MYVCVCMCVRRNMSRTARMRRAGGVGGLRVVGASLLLWRREVEMTPNARDDREWHRRRRLLHESRK